MEGWFKVHRSIVDHELLWDKPFNKLSAWIDMIGMATHKEIEVSRFGDTSPTLLKRGQFYQSYKRLAERWGWSRRKVRRFMVGLEVAQMCTYSKDTLGLIVTINNYSKYQDRDEDEAHTSRTPLAHSSHTVSTPNKNVKNVKKEDKDLYTATQYTGRNGKYKVEVEEIFTHFVSLTNRRFAINEIRRKLIVSRLKQGYSIKDFMVVNWRFANDDWDRRHEFMDPKYAWGIVNGVDRFEKWLNKPKTVEEIKYESKLQRKPTATPNS